MSFPRYPAYKDSGVEWLGEVPTHWAIRPLKYITALRSGGTPSKDNLDFWDGATPWASAKDLKCETLEDTEDHITDAAIEVGAAELVPAGAVLVVVRGMILARTFPVSLAAVPMAINQDLKALVPFRDVRSAYLARALQAAAEESTRRIDEAGHGTKALRMDAWTSLPLPVPPLEEQDAISTFLDRETAKIDALIAEQERLIELLKEKRQAVISHAVTKGLDPDVPMKDSGVEWLGQVPAHWEVRRIASISTKITNGYVGPTRDILVEDGVRYLQSLHVKRNRIVFDTPYFVSREWSEAHEKSILRAGDVLIVQTGDIGQVAVVPDEFAGCNCHALIIVSPAEKKLDGSWLSWILNSSYGRQSLLSIQTGALHPHLNCGNVRDVYVPLPPIDEQRAITLFVEANASRHESLISEIERAASLLMERRAALVSAAVTGQIFVAEQ